MKYFTRIVILISSMLFLLTFVMCGSSNRLMEYDFNDRTAAAVMAMPPPAEVFTDSWFMIDGDNILETAVKIGTTIAKEVEVQKTRDKLDNALQEVDVAERIRERMLERCARYLRCRPVDNPEDADFLFDMYMQNYGIDAQSWTASVHFKIDVKIYFIDNEKGIEVWEKRVRERMPVTHDIFGLPGAAGDIITAVSLSELSEEEMIAGFEHLADYTADQIARRLQQDFTKARSKRN